MHNKVISAQIIASGGGTYTSNGVVVKFDVSSFAIYYSVAGADASVDFFYIASADGENFVTSPYSIKRGVVATSGPGGDGKDIISFAPPACEAIKIYAVNNGTGDATVTTTLVVREGGFQGAHGEAQDGITSAQQVISYEHHEIHGGSSFWICHNASLANGQISSVAITTPDTAKLAHMIVDIRCSADATFDILESVTSFDGGAALTEYNRYRDSSTAATVVALGGSTAANAITPTGGTSIFSELFNSTKGVQWSRSGGEEIILKRNSKYLFRVTNGVSANTVTILLEWYEHTNR